eukprot:1158952-Pelagomonas_calceolata.AAC.7
MQRIKAHFDCSAGHSGLQLLPACVSLGTSGCRGQKQPMAATDNTQRLQLLLARTRLTCKPSLPSIMAVN